MLGSSSEGLNMKTITIEDSNYYAIAELVDADIEDPLFVINKVVAIIEGLAVDITAAVVCDQPQLCERLENKAAEKWRS
jgi:hypothetical protein